jgi:beta-galactosidase
MSEIFYGGDYNPEQWPEEVWHEDVRLMREAGVNLVSVAIFAWSKLEPEEGRFEFAWLDRLLDLLHAHGIGACLATATAAPPPWLALKYPQSLPVTKDGVRLGVGSRQQYSPSSPDYRQLAARLVREIATRYRGHPALRLWHINNEYGCHVFESFDPDSAAAFRAWLRACYGTLEALNEAWGTAFWSQRYGAWDEINPPAAAPTFINPTQQLDWRRFCSDALLSLFRMEREILREITPEVPATTNFIGVHKPLDEWRWAEELDIVSNDAYPDPAAADAGVYAALQSDVMRSLKGGAPWILMEQAPNQVQWRPRNALKAPGVMRLWSLQAVARGARGVMFFQWRQSKAGAEKFHSGMVPHAGTDHRTWREVRALGRELRGLGEVLESRVQAEAAIVFDWEAWWALEGDAHPSDGVRYLEAVYRLYAPLWRRNVTVDFVRPDADLSAYKLVVVPNLYLVRDAAAANLERYVAAGGVLVMGFFSGIVDEHDQVRLGGYPAPFRKLLGLHVEEFDALPVGATTDITATTEGEPSFSADLWADVITLEGAEALATFNEGFYAGRPAVTEHAFGAGSSFYLGTRPDDAGTAWLLAQACARAGIQSAELPAGIELLRRSGDGAEYLLLLNHLATPVRLELRGAAHDLATGETQAGALELPPYGVTFLRAETPLHVETSAPAPALRGALMD